MINRREILELAREFGLAPHIVEKDYVLAWVLAGIYNHPDLGGTWIFKGGTCLKKCYFETYRFSEDLDFTLTDAAHLGEAFLTEAFSTIAAWVYYSSGIEVPVEALRFEIYQNPRGRTAVEGRLAYRGPLQPRGDLPRIKLDLTADEQVVLVPAEREVHHPYSDRPDAAITALCYPYEELFAEKLRALTERERPRDLYDVVHLYWHGGETSDRALILSTLEQKCAFKGIEAPTIEGLENRPERAELEAEWGNMLAHQLPELPPFEQFWRELPQVLDWLFGSVVEMVHGAAGSYPLPAGTDLSWQPPRMVQAWHMPYPLETIRFAGANRLCVELGYEGSTRLIEPYSLRRTQEGNIVLHAIRHMDGGHRSYRIDRIQGARVTNISFAPRYAIELSASGPLSIGMGTRTTQARSSPSRGRRLTGTQPRARTRTSHSLTYVIACLACEKSFSRSRYDTRLNPHKTREGYPCLGRTGYLVETKY
ncbi:MAG TPA: nucleotidyl transferase AbiEii/AbiGii toxin family protein [Blastocatellia bacterium]|nr:nucleotidyl transferase AbiEii/AbiGii toxin family protein [Blastocatellia bacterium]